MNRLKWYDWIPFLGMWTAAYRQAKTGGLIMLIFFIYHSFGMLFILKLYLLLQHEI